MQCLKCSADTRVLETRQTSHGLRRRRECTACRSRFATLEQDAERAEKAAELCDRFLALVAEFAPTPEPLPFVPVYDFDTPCAPGGIERRAWFAEHWREFMLPRDLILNRRRPIAHALEDRFDNGTANAASIIYFLIDDDLIYYVGQTTRFQYRMTRHGLRFPLTEIATLIVPAIVRDVIEALYIDWFDPPQNAKWPVCERWQSAFAQALYDGSAWQPGYTLPA